MTTKVTIEFICKKCGLLTVGTAEIPPGANPSARVTFGMNCSHCGRAVTNTMSVRRAKKQYGGQAS